ncbi:uncharacterized protein LOC105223966 [Bactrocera dorsalis]|uniref:Uncharacterized protein LOC105223966 n=1 Tax=Bactrocera dorsalis TaxID=27457 RepID=A0ABM3JYA3_BACDO|nr:uncharacterized protein LOC105223966 [Bactrocera dorsalis]
MIDEQHPIQVATLPLGLKCHTPIQQQQASQQQQTAQQQQHTSQQQQQASQQQQQAVQQQQLASQQQQQTSQQQPSTQHQSASMMMSGSQRMLTTLATALKATTTSGATTSDNGTSTGTGIGVTHDATKPLPTTSSNTATTMPGSMVAATALTAELGGVAGASAMTIGATVPTSREALCGGGGGVNGVACGEINGNPTTPTASAAAVAAAAAASFYTNVIGNCNGHKNNSNAGNDNKCYNSVNMKASNASSLGQRLEAQQHQQQQLHSQQQQQMALHVPVTGPGPGRPPGTCSPNGRHPLHPSLYGSERQALADFNMNVVGNNESIGGVGIVNNDGCTMAAMYTTNNNNNNCIDHNGNSNLTNCLNGNNDNTNNHANNNNMFLAMQRQAADNCATLQHKQQQQQQHHLQLHFGTHLHGQFAHDDHSPCPTPPMPPSTLRNGNKCDALSTAAAAAVLGLPVALPLSLSLHLPPLSASAACRTALSSDPAAAAAVGGTQCAYCCQPICDRYIMRVVDTSFHEGCLKCATCALHLVHSCYARDGKLYCRIDYERQFLRNRCLGCGHRIACDELVMRTFDSVFHLKCFACVVCGGLLKKGEQYVVKQGQLFCRLDYEKEVEMLQGYDFYGDDLFAPKLDGRRGPKRPRTILNTQQRRAFKASFELSPKPCRKVRENLAKETGLSLRIVQVWFQNQRAKVKKIQKKAKQEHTKGASDSQDSQESDNSNLAKIKDEAHSDCESLLESPFSACGSSGGVGAGGGGGGVASCADGAVKMRSIKDENENTSFNCMETNKENCNKTNEPFLSTVLGLSYSTFQQLMGPLTQSPMVNPIDRLYSMQNSYFRPEELAYNGCSKDLVEP